MKRMVLVVGLVVASLSALPAAADPKAAAACAAGLSAPERLIYDTALPKVIPGANLREVIRAAARSLVLDGKLSRTEAKAAAETAGLCLKAVLN